MTIQELHNLNLEPYDIEGYAQALKNYTLFSKLNDEVVIFVCKKHMGISFDYLSKQEFEYDIRVLDETSFEKLYNAFLEFRTDKHLVDIQKEQDEFQSTEDEFNISEFLQTSSDILTSEESAPIIKFVNSLFFQAIKKKASDIHIETHEYKCEIRYRIDGVLQKHIDLDKNIMALVISRIKVISNLDISEKRLPQDGRTQIKIANKTLDVRVSVLPTFYGERVVMRILMQSDDILSLDELGFSKNTIKTLDDLLKNSYGMILVAGPTGSGKSTTLHSVLQKIYSPEKNIITVEDPVEYKSDKINQIQVNQKVGLSFANGLRSILRQDPDIVMVGEIRDAETASIAVQAALTGHLMFSTLHTNRATAAITRLVDMGIEKFLISSSLLAIVAQRLIRELCPYCKLEDKNAKDAAADFALPKKTVFYKNVGCKECNHTGFIKRVAIEEIFVVDSEVKEILKGDFDDHVLLKHAVKNGMVTLDEHVKQMLKRGETSVSEAYRIGIK